MDAAPGAVQGGRVMRYIDADAMLDRIPNLYERRAVARWTDEAPDADVVPWEFLERYADWFCAQVSYPEFVREAKGFYENTTRAMDGGTIGEQEGDDDV